MAEVAEVAEVAKVAKVTEVAEVVRSHADSLAMSNRERALELTNLSQPPL